jgi:hypothetical protein
MHTGSVRIVSNSAKMGVPPGGAVRDHRKDGHRPPDKLGWNNCDGVYFMPFAPNRQTLEAFGIWFWGSGIPDKSRDRHACLSRLCRTSGCIISDARRILGGLVACPAWCKLGT